MKRSQTPCVLISIVLSGILKIACAQDAAQNALSSVAKLLDKLTANVNEEGEKEKVVYGKNRRFCQSTEAQYKTTMMMTRRQRDKAQAFLDEANADIAACDSQIEEIAGELASDQADLEAAIRQRKRENDDFKKADKELSDTIRSMSAAITIIGNQLRTNPFALAQVDTSKLDTVMKTFGLMMDASSLPINDKEKLVALMQSNEKQAQIDEMGTMDDDNPQSVSKSKSILDLIEDMKEKAESQLSELRETETSRDHDHALASQARETQIEESAKELKMVKYDRMKLGQKKGVAEGDLSEVQAALDKDTKTLEDLVLDCSNARRDYQNYMNEMGLELRAISQAKSHITEAMNNDALIQTDAANADADSDVPSTSFLQVRKHQNKAKIQAVNIVKQLARRHRSSALFQLASRMKAMLRYGQNAKDGEDPLAKVKDLVYDMIKKLERDLNAQRNEQVFCETEIKKTKFKLGDLNFGVDKLKTETETASAREIELADEKKQLESDIATESKDMAESMAIWEEETKDHNDVSQGLEDALRGVRRAITALTKFYGKRGRALLQEASADADSASGESSATSASSAPSDGIIKMLEILADDIAQRFAKEDKRYHEAKEHFEKESDDFKISMVSKKKTVMFLAGQLVRQKRLVSDIQGDMAAKQEERDSVIDYGKKLRDRCIAKPNEFEEIRKKRQDEIDGLNEALEILEREGSFVQSDRNLRRHVA